MFLEGEGRLVPLIMAFEYYSRPRHDVDAFVVVTSAVGNGFFLTMEK